MAALLFASLLSQTTTSAASEAEAEPTLIEVIAEHGVGDGHPATEVPIGHVSDIAADAAGNVYFVDAVHSRVRRIAPDGIIGTVFNSHSLEIPSSPRAIAVDPQGVALYVADAGANRVWLVHDGIVAPFAGTGAYGLSGDGGQARDAQLNGPAGVAVGHDGTVYIADMANHRIRAVASDGTIRTVAGDLSPDIDVADAWEHMSLFQPELLATAADGSLYVVDRKRRRVQRILADGSAEELPLSQRITGIGLRPDGSLLIASAGVLFEVVEGGLVNLTNSHALPSPRLLLRAPTSSATIGESAGSFGYGVTGRRY